MKIKNFATAAAAAVAGLVCASKIPYVIGSVLNDVFDMDDRVYSAFGTAKASLAILTLNVYFLTISTPTSDTSHLNLHQRHLYRERECDGID